MEPLRIVVESSGNPISWFNIAQFVLTAVIAIITVYIACQQHKVNKNRLKNELYEKRFVVYSSTRYFLKYIANNNSITDHIINEFSKNTSLSYFLFDEDIKDYLKELEDRANELLTFLSFYNEYKTEDFANKINIAVQWFLDQEKTVCDNNFKKYLQIK